MRRPITMVWLPQRKETKARLGATILSEARRERIVIPTRCQGVAGCLLCKVRVHTLDAVTSPTVAEHMKLGEALLEKGIRLACQTCIIRSDVCVELLESPLQAFVRRQRAVPEYDPSP
jgi:ferredoxin